MPASSMFSGVTRLTDKNSAFAECLYLDRKDSINIYFLKASQFQFTFVQWQ